MTYKVVYSPCYGGFGLSPKAKKLLRARGVVLGDDDDPPIERHNPHLVAVVEELGGVAASGPFTPRLEIQEVGGVYRIDECGGHERVIEPDDYEWMDPRTVQDGPKCLD